MCGHFSLIFFFQMKYKENSGRDNLHLQQIYSYGYCNLNKYGLYILMQKDMKDVSEFDIPFNYKRGVQSSEFDLWTKTSQSCILFLCTYDWIFQCPVIKYEDRFTIKLDYTLQHKQIKIMILGGQAILILEDKTLIPWKKEDDIYIIDNPKGKILDVIVDDSNAELHAITLSTNLCI